MSESWLSEPRIDAVFVVVSSSTFEIYVRMPPDWLADFQFCQNSAAEAVSPSASPFSLAPALAVLGEWAPALAGAPGASSTHWAGALPNDRILSIPEKVLYRTWQMPSI